MEHNSKDRVSRRDFLRISALVAGSATLAACGSSQPQPPAAPASSGGGAAPAPTAAPQAAAAPVKLRWWGGVPDVSGPKAAADAWNKDHPDTQVEYVQYSNNTEGNIKLDTALLVPDEVDVFVSYGLVPFKKRADGGLVEPLDGYLNGFDLDKEFGKAETSWDGKTWCIIANLQPFLVYCNKQAFDEAGLQVPAEWTWDQFAEINTKLTKGSGASKRNGSWVDLADEWVQWLKGYDFQYKDKCTTNFDDPLYEWAYNQKVKFELTDKTSLPTADQLAGKLQVQNEFLQGHVAMLFVGSWVLRYIKDLKNYPHDFLTTFAPVPSKADQPYTARPGNCDDRVAINSKAKNKQQAYDFMKWWTTEGYIYMTPYGRTTRWKGRNPEDSAKALLSDFPDYEKYFDVDAYKRVMFQTYADLNFGISTITAGRAEIGAVITEEGNRIYTGEVNVKDGLANMKKRADEALGKVCS